MGKWDWITIGKIQHPRNKTRCSVAKSRDCQRNKIAGLIHNRDAEKEDCYKILKEEGIQDIGGIMHSYNGDVEYMKRFLDLGMHISFRV